MAKSNHKGKSAARLLGVQILFEMEINGKNTKTVVKRLTEDYLKGQYESKFLFRVDPKMASSCGCGVSFSPKK